MSVSECVQLKLLAREMSDGQPHTRPDPQADRSTKAVTESRAATPRLIRLGPSGVAFAVAIVLVLVAVHAGTAIEVLSVLGAAMAIAGGVLLLPRSFKRYGTFAAVCVTVLGILAFVVPEFRSSSRESARSSGKVDLNELAESLSDGPFDIELPEPFVVGDKGIEPMRDSSPSSGQALVKVMMTLAEPKDAVREHGELRSFTAIEIFPSHKLAVARLKAAVADYTQRYGKPDRGSACFHATGSQGELRQCFAVRKYAYVDANIWPADTANDTYPPDIISALLRYTDEKTADATG
jgi:hypothetical protein